MNYTKSTKPAWISAPDSYIIDELKYWVRLQLKKMFTCRSNYALSRKCFHQFVLYGQVGKKMTLLTVILEQIRTIKE